MLASVALGACGNSVMGADVVDVPRLEGGNNQIGVVGGFGFEGQRRYVAVIGPAMGDDNVMAASVATAPTSGVVIERTECTRIRCAIVAHIDDRIANRGAPIPDVPSAEAVNLSLQGTIFNYTATIRVLPLDAADATSTGTALIGTQAVYSTLVLPAGRVARSGRDEALRFAVLGRVEIHGTFDLSPMAALAGPGGSAGGTAPTGDGQGPFPGRGNLLAGGGGGYGEAGTAGMGAGGVMGGAGGAATMDRAPRTLVGGSGGGAGGGGAGGAGAGAMLLAAYGDADYEGAQFIARGGAGEGAGGGGAGGLFIFGGNPTGSFTVDTAGGAGGTAGGATGGRGGIGRVRLDSAVTGANITAGISTPGVRFDLGSLPPIVRTPALTIRGTAQAGSLVRVNDEYGGVVTMMGQATADGAGGWSIPVTLTREGVYSFVAYDTTSGAMAPSFSGTRVIIRRGSTGTLEIFAGAVDVAYLPMME